MSVKISQLPNISSENILSSNFPASDIDNDTTYKVSMQNIYDNFSIYKNNNIKTTSYTLSVNDYNSNIVFSSTDPETPVELIIPRHKKNRIPLGSTIGVVRNNIGDVIITPGSGVNIYPSCNKYLKNRYSAASLTKIDLNTWFISGDLSNQANGYTYDRFIENVVLLLHLDNNVVDKSLFPKSCSLVNMNDGGLFSTGAAKFGTHGIRFDGTKTLNSETSRLLMNMPSGVTSQWTYEMWFKPPVEWNNSSGIKFLLSASSGSRPFGSYMDLYYNNGNIVFAIVSLVPKMSTDGSIQINVGTISSSWHHIAISRSGSTVRLFLDGNQIGSNIILIGDDKSSNNANLNKFLVGSVSAFVGIPPSNQWTGTSVDIDEIRITEAYRYTANFSLPQTQFQDP